MSNIFVEIRDDKIRGPRHQLLFQYWAVMEEMFWKAISFLPDGDGDKGELVGPTFKSEFHFISFHFIA